MCWIRKKSKRKLETLGKEMKVTHVCLRGRLASCDGSVRLSFLCTLFSSSDRPVHALDRRVFSVFVLLHRIRTISISIRETEPSYRFLFRVTPQESIAEWQFLAFARLAGLAINRVWSWILQFLRPITANPRISLLRNIWKPRGLSGVTDLSSTKENSK